MKKLQFIVLAFAALFSVQSCQKSASNTISTTKATHRARMMFVNGCTGTTQVSGSFGSTVISGTTDVNLFDNSGYQYITLDSINIPQPTIFKNKATGAQLVSYTFTCTDDNFYTALIGGSVSSPTMTFTTDHYDGMGAGMAKVRFVNLSVDMPNATFLVNNITTFAGIGPAQITTFTDIAAGTLSFSTFDPAHPTTTLRLYGGRVIEAGKYYTIFLTGSTTGTGSADLTLNQITYAPN
jgi:hypothetical protein